MLLTHISRVKTMHCKMSPKLGSYSIRTNTIRIAHASVLISHRMITNIFHTFNVGLVGESAIYSFT